MKVVIAGAGFGGVQTALDLANQAPFEVRLISDKSYFEYHAALYRSATGRSPLEVAVPLNELFSSAKNVEVETDQVTAVDGVKKTVQGQSGSSYAFDALILALGNVTNYYNIKGLAEYSYGVKSIQEALELKRHLHEGLVSGQLAERDYVIVGAGATGVEVAGELRAYVNKLRDKHKIEPAEFNIDLIEGSPRVLPAMPEAFSRKVEDRLTKLGVNIHTNTRVESESYEELAMPGGKIKSRTVIWTAGASNNPLFARHPELFSLDKRGKVLVNEFLETKPDIYVIGDSAATTYSGMAQTALYDAHFVAQDLVAKSSGKPRRYYLPKRPAYAIPVGPYWAAVQIGNLALFGFLGWALRRLVDLHLFLTFLPLRKALFTWRYGFVYDEACPVCRDQ